MKTTIEPVHDTSFMFRAHSSFRSLCMKQETRRFIQIMIAAIVVTVVSVIGWQIHINVVEKHDNQSSSSSNNSTLSPTLSPTVVRAPTPFPIKTLDYIAQFVDGKERKQFIYKYFPRCQNRLLQMEADLKRFMDQKIAIENIFKNVTCDLNGETYFETWYSHVMQLTPTFLIGSYHMPAPIQLNLPSFDFYTLCRMNDDGWITHIDISFKQCNGTIDFMSLPQLQSLQVLKLNDNLFTGAINFTSLPQSLEVLQLDYNRFTGTINTTSLPQSLKQLILRSNQFTGTVDLTSLPQFLVDINLDTNKFHGNVDLLSLPPSLKALKLGANQFTGTIDLTSLPDDMEELWLYDNKLTGTVDLTLLPQSLQVLALSRNSFYGSVNLITLPESMADLSLDKNQFTGSVDLTSLPQLLHILMLSDNKFTGLLDLRKIPHELLSGQFEKSQNQFSGYIHSNDTY